MTYFNDQGTPGNDVLNGGGGSDDLYGGGGDDVLNGGGGNDDLYGGSGDDALNGGNGNDDLYGGSGDDALNGGNGNDDMSGGSGSDDMSGGSGSDDMYGDSGDDDMSGDSGNDDMFGGSGNDHMSGDSGNDDMYGGSGDDDMYGGNGNDDMYGGSGNDDMYGGAGDDWLFGGAGSDSLFGGAGNDVLVGDDGWYGWDGWCWSYKSGSGYADYYLDGGSGNDLVLCGRGNDKANYTFGENKYACDAYFGGRGYDTLYLTLTDGEAQLSSVQHDIERFKVWLNCNADASRDWGRDFQFCSFNLTVDGFEALDVVPIAVDDGDDGAFTTEKDESLTFDVKMIEKLLDNDIDIDGDTLAIVGVSSLPDNRGDVVLNKDGTITYTPHAGFSGTDQFSYRVSDGKGGFDTGKVTVTVTESAKAALFTNESDPPEPERFVDFNGIVKGQYDPESYYNALAGDDKVKLPDNTIEAEEAGYVVVDGQLNHFSGGDGDDRIVGGVGLRNHISGDAGDDTITGGELDDRIEGGPGQDVLNGGGGNDTFLVIGTDTGHDSFSGGAGFDQILGGEGDDVIGVNIYFGTDTVERIDGKTGVNTIAGTSNGDDIDLSGTELLNIATIDGGDGDDQIVGGGGNDMLRGGDGADFLDGGDGDDVLVGGAGFDQLLGGSGADRLFAGAGPFDRLFGGDGDDELYGGDNVDELFGEAGDDDLYGGAGDDTMDGGDGNDTLGAPLDDPDLDLESGDGNDVLNGGRGADTLRGGRGNDVLDGGSDNLGGDAEPPDEAVFGFDGSERSDYHFTRDTRSGDILVTDRGDRTPLTNEGSDRLLNIEQVNFVTGEGVVRLWTGTDEKDVIGGTENFVGPDYIFAGAGNDQILAGDGADVVVWMPGDSTDDGPEEVGDELFGGGGFDELQLNLPADDLDTVKAHVNPGDPNNPEDDIVTLTGQTDGEAFKLTLHHDVEWLSIWSLQGDLLFEDSPANLVSRAMNQEVTFTFAELSEMYAEQQALELGTADADFLI
jgi:Ca2+-binding RTX toxin-like protein